MAAAIATLLIDLELEAVAYMRPLALRGQDRIVGSGFEHAEAGVRLIGSGGRSIVARWAQSGVDEFLWIGDSMDAVVGDWVPEIEEVEVASWRSVIGKRIVSVGVAWQRIEDTKYEAWSLRLDFEPESIVIALGERDWPSNEVTYIPDCVVVIFDPPIARAYTPAASIGSAWCEL